MNQKCSFARELRVAGVLAMVVLFVLSGDALSQDRWVRLETDNKEVSFALPDNYLFHEERTSEGERKIVSAFHGGVSFEATAADQIGSKSNLARILVDESRRPAVLNFEFEGIPGRSVTYTDRGYEHKIYLATNKGYYVLSITSMSKDAPEAGRFLRSIRAKNKALFQAAGIPTETEDDFVSMKTMKISPEVEAALDRKIARIDRSVTFQPLSSYTPCKNDLSLRPAFVATRPRPELNGLLSSVRESGDVRMNVQLLASGQVGDIVVFSDLDKSVLRAFANAAAKMRFVPAVDKGTPVDSCETIRSGFGVTRGTMIFTSPG